MGNGLVLFLVFPAQLLKPRLLLPNLLGEGLVFLLIIANEGPALVLVSGQIPAQRLQLLQSVLAGLPLCLQGGQAGVQGGQLLGDLQGALLQVTLALGLAS